jgi:hypothetical protein
VTKVDRYTSSRVSPGTYGLSMAGLLCYDIPDTKRTLLRPGEPPKPANQFFYTVLGDSIQLDTSHVDLMEARAAFEKIKAGAQAVFLYM